MIISTLIGRYIAAKFVTMIAGCFTLCLGLIFLVDFIEILRQSGKFGGASMGLIAWITVLRLPAYGELTLPFAVLVGTIMSFLTLSRSSELVIIRAAGISVWQFVIPGLIVAVLLGLFSVLVYNPMAANARALSEELRAEAFGRSTSLLKTKAGAWLRQDSIDGQSVISAKATADNGLTLAGVTVLQYDRAGTFTARVDALRAELRHGYWTLYDAAISRPAAATDIERYDRFQIATYLKPEQVTNALGSAISISIWELPARIALAEKAGLRATIYRVQMEQLIARPLLLAAMVLLGATVSLRAFRFGGIQTMVVTGLVAGFGFFILAEMSRQLGLSELASPTIAIWVPIGVASALAATALLYQEDG